MRDIWVFLNFDSFYQYFIYNFSKIVKLSTLILKTSSAAKLLEKLLLSIDVDKTYETGISGDGGDWES